MGSGEVTLQSWLQERQYSRPYHWHQERNDVVEYALRSRIVLDLAGLTGRPQHVGRPRLLDVGCGDARFVADALPRAAAFGVDPSLRALGFARTLVRRARFLSGGAATLPFASGTFDVVTLLDVIEHVPDAQEAAAVREARRVLKPGGRLVMSTTTTRSMREWKHHRHYSVRGFARLFDDFTDVRLVGLIPYFPTLRVWMGAPVLWRAFRSRVRECAPDEAQTVIGVGIKR